MNKEIIEIIQPYMDKELSEGCYIEYNKCIYKVVAKQNQINSLGDIVYLVKCLDYLGNIIKLELNSELEDYKILGHYSITAILKYISIIENIEVTAYRNNFSINRIDNGYYEGTLPNKPLHLFSEKEQKDLLELLKKLGKKKK